MGGVLEGLRVIDFTRVIAGSWCTMYLSDMGAEVLKIEAPMRLLHHLQSRQKKHHA